jgi:hypothetical protein
MRELRFVMLTEDGEQLVVEDTECDVRFAVRLDDALRDAVHAEPPRRPAAAGPGLASERTLAEPAISPREIQVRVRAGEAPQVLAEAYAMPLERVMRFAGAVMDERIRIADEARRGPGPRRADVGA